MGCAPDTFLGAGIQTCRKLIDDGWIGEPIAASAFMTNHGHESWHPDPEFYYQAGGGPMFDMGPYYLTALVNLMGPVQRVTGSARATFPQRTITSAAQVRQDHRRRGAHPRRRRAGLRQRRHRHRPHHLRRLVRQPAVHRNLRYRRHAERAGPQHLRRPGQVRRYTEREWSEIPLTHLYAENSRGLGVADMATAIVSGRPHRASGDLAYHVLEIMESIHVASDRGPARPDSRAHASDRPRCRWV